MAQLGPLSIPATLSSCITYQKGNCRGNASVVVKNGFSLSLSLSPPTLSISLPFYFFISLSLALPFSCSLCHSLSRSLFIYFSIHISKAQYFLCAQYLVCIVYNPVRTQGRYSHTGQRFHAGPFPVQLHYRTALNIEQYSLLD